MSVDYTQMFIILFLCVVPFRSICSRIKEIPAEYKGIDGNCLSLSLSEKPLELIFFFIQTDQLLSYVHNCKN